MQLNQLGKIVIEQWNDLPNRFPIVALDQFIVMPNHIHGIIQTIVGAYKSLCVHHCLQWIKSNNPTFFMGTLWQRNYWEHIVRDKNELGRIRDYIRNNPVFLIF